MKVKPYQISKRGQDPRNWRHHSFSQDIIYKVIEINLRLKKQANFYDNTKYSLNLKTNITCKSAPGLKRSLSMTRNSLSFTSRTPIHLKTTSYHIRPKSGP